jgi:hypothetical protein
VKIIDFILQLFSTHGADSKIHFTDSNPPYNRSRSKLGSYEGPDERIDEGPSERDEKLKPGLQRVISTFTALDPLF